MRTLLLLYLMLLSLCASSVQLSPCFSAWLAAQTNFTTWSAEFTQTRTLKTLTEPLIGTGHVWFEAPNRFHWELEHPAPTVVIRNGNDLIVMYPRLKRVERYSLSENSGPWRDALALLQAGFPRSQIDLESQFNILSQTANDQKCEVVLEPKSASARRIMPQLKIEIDSRNFSLLSTRLEFADGSTLRNDFTKPISNPKLDESLFSPNIPPDYKTVDPLKK
jgi:outer membrane lipoprotein-sorting protein